MTVRLTDEVEERVRLKAGANVAGWIRHAIDVALDGPQKEDLALGRVLHRLDDLEDFRGFIEARIAKSEKPPMARQMPTTTFSEPRVEIDR